MYGKKNQVFGPLPDGVLATFASSTSTFSTRISCENHFTTLVPEKIRKLCGTRPLEQSLLVFLSIWAVAAIATKRSDLMRRHEELSGKGQISVDAHQAPPDSAQLVGRCSF